DRAASLRRLHHRVENRTQLLTVGILIRDQARSAGQNVLGISEAFHQQQLLRISVDAVLREPRSQMARVGKPARSNAAVPVDESLAGSGFEGLHPARSVSAPAEGHRGSSLR